MLPHTYKYNNMIKHEFKLTITELLPLVVFTNIKLNTYFKWTKGKNILPFIF